MGAGIFLAYLLLPIVLAIVLILCVSLGSFVWIRLESWRETRALMRRARELTKIASQHLSTRPVTTLDDLGLPPESRAGIDAAVQAEPSGELTIAKIDAKGRTYGIYGDIPRRISVSEEAFIQRARNPVDIVVVDGSVLVRKQMGFSDKAFYSEWAIMLHLLANSAAHVPVLRSVNEHKRILYMDFIPGRMMNSIAPSVEEQRRVATRHFSEPFFEMLEQQFERVHRAGVADLDVGFGNVVEDSRTGLPALIDFENAKHYANRNSLRFVMARDRDRLEINYLFGRQLMTEQSAHAALRANIRSKTGWYAPIDFGCGLGVPGFWSIDAGTGRWEHFNGHIVGPLVSGKRILDLGSNNAAMPLMMLRAGAKEVICVEQQDKFIQQGQLVLRLFEYRDIRNYKLTYYAENMLAVLSNEWGEFDIITAFCSLYHLSEEDMARVVRRASTLAPIMILQGNLHEGTFRKSSVGFLQQLLEEHGFPSVEVYAPPGYARPLLVGRRCRVSPGNHDDRKEPIQAAAIE